MIKIVSFDRYYSTLVNKSFTTYEEARDAEGDFYQKVMSVANDIHDIVENYNELAEEYEEIRLSKAAEGSTMEMSEITSYERKFDALVKTLYEAGICKLDADTIDNCANNVEEDDDNETVTAEHSPKRVVVTVHRVKRSGNKKPSAQKRNNRAECEGCPLQERCKDCN